MYKLEDDVSTGDTWKHISVCVSGEHEEVFAANRCLPTSDRWVSHQTMSRFLFVIFKTYTINSVLHRVHPACVAAMTGRCSLFGRHHVHTFDGVLYEFPGDCSYLLAGDCNHRSFSLLGESQSDSSIKKKKKKNKQISILIWGLMLILCSVVHRDCENKYMKITYILEAVCWNTPLPFDYIDHRSQTCLCCCSLVKFCICRWLCQWQKNWSHSFSRGRLWVAPVCGRTSLPGRKKVK